MGEYDTALTPEEETAFRAWKASYAPHDSGEDYDLRGAYKAGSKPDKVSGHWPDTFKKPNHPTFSNESKYAVGPNASRAGRWEGEQFIPPMPHIDYLYDSLDLSGSSPVVTAKSPSRPAPGIAPDLAASRPERGMGGSVAPSPVQRVQGAASQAPGRERALDPDELMMLADTLQAQIEEASRPGPSAVEPALERELNVPFWLRQYGQQEGIDSGVPQPKPMTREEAIDSNKYMTAEEKARYKAYKAYKK